MRRGRNRVLVSGASSMFVLAGLPPEVHTWAVGHLERLRPTARVVGAPSSSQDGALYPDGVVDALVRSVAGFAIRRRANGPDRPVTPKFITLLYVPSRDKERLLHAFDFAVLAGSLTALMAFGETGRQLRHERRAVEQTLAEAASEIGQSKVDMDEVLQRIGRRSDREALLLPPQNYHLTKGLLASLFVEYRQGRRRSNDRFPELVSEELTHDELPRLPFKEVRRAYVDARQVAFLVADPAAYDGSTREVDESAEIRSLQSTLRSLYRFGAPLPQGFHHDAQRRDGNNFQQFPFDCEQEGRVAVSAPHANIYPNDFVRAKRKEKI